MADPVRVLIVEVDWPVASLLAAALEDEGMTTDVVQMGRHAIAHKRRFNPHVVVIGLGLSQPNDLSLVETFAAEGIAGS